MVESVKKGVPNSETVTRRFGVDRATVKRTAKQLDERGTLESPGRLRARGPRAGTREGYEVARAEDLQERPWATLSQRESRVPVRSVGGEGE